MRGRTSEGGRRKSTCLLTSAAEQRSRRDAELRGSVDSPLLHFIFVEDEREELRGGGGGGERLAVETDSRQMLSWGEKGRESAERNRMKEGRVEQS